MVRILLCISLFFLFATCYSQSNKVVDYSLVYDLVYIRDTSSCEYSDDYKCLLMRSGHEGRFRDYNAHFNDSMGNAFAAQYPGFDQGLLPQKRQAELVNKLLEESSKWRKPNTDKYRIMKDFNRGIVNTVLIYGITPQHLEQPLNLNWQLTSVKDSIAGMSCSQATVRYGGRNYTAWYNPDIPISDGPYVFSGLPGLIVKISDEQNWYTYTLSKMNLMPHARFWHNRFILDASVPISRKVFVQTMRAKKENPKMMGATERTPENIRLRMKNSMQKRFDLLLEQLE